ncbi:metaxin 1 [Schizosaccharomyces japonicus yFS275]|uniref:Metaxin 1 n=1 Tax=Schizosaccharomyces japonicus (strain yFS275 / FY16936) TaxID=402676 RepID=B6JYV9_SCHJY|nr:metaxin 1 [Schizosaccharomyces japonicus yFS275]EEB06727.1 metaxin 1 [Schizosaccharomyces japonicus yFS275]
MQNYKPVLFLKKFLSNFPLVKHDDPYEKPPLSVETAPILFVENWNKDPESPAREIYSRLWQTYIRLTKQKITVVNASSQASPDSILPILQVNGERLVYKSGLFDHFLVHGYRNETITPWLDLLSESVEPAILYTMFLDQENTESVNKRWLYPTSWPLSYVLQSRKSLQIKQHLLDKMKSMNGEYLYAEAAEAFSLMAEKLGTSTYFLDVEEPSFMDIAIYAYGSILLELPLQNRQLQQSLQRHPNLVSLIHSVSDVAGFSRR